MITYGLSDTTHDLQAILHLQQQNLPTSLSSAEISSQGFVTVSHSLDDLQKMNGYEKSLIIKDHDNVVGYILAMTQHSKQDIPVLVPMFDIFDAVLYHNQTVSSYNYIVVGQVCVAKDYRGQGVLDEAYSNYKAFFQSRYDFAITEIATANQRSLNAHRRIGFSELHRYTDATGIEWSIVIWDWSQDTIHP